MKFSINTKAFFNNIRVVSRAISTKTTIPILTGMKIMAHDGNLKLVGSNADISIVKVITPDKKNQLSVTEDGDIVVPSKFFNSVVRNMPKQIMNMEVDNSTYQVNISSGASHFKINGLDAGNYPHLPNVKANSNASVTLNGDVLKDIIKKVALNASTQESRPIITGVHLFAKGNTLTAVATDSHRLGQIQLAVKDEADFDLDIPAKSLNALSSIIPSHSLVKMASMENQVLFSVNGLSFYSRLLEGNYPDTSQLIPKTSKTTLTMKASDLLPIIQRSSLVSHASRNNVAQLQLTADKNQLELTTNSPDVGRNKENAQANIDGNDITLSFNPDYVSDALKTLGDQAVHIDFLSSLRPFVIKPVKKTGFTQIITPVRTF